MIARRSREEERDVSEELREMMSVFMLRDGLTGEERGVILEEGMSGEGWSVEWSLGGEWSGESTGRAKSYVGLARELRIKWG